MRVFDQFIARWVGAYLPMQYTPTFSSFNAHGRELWRCTGQLDVNRVSIFLQ